MKKIALRRIPAIIGLLILFVSLAGCYTVIRRPGNDMDVESGYPQEDYYSEQTIPPEYLWYDPFYDWYYPGAYGRWRYYYTYPWWWNDYWYWHPNSGEPGVSTDTDRHIWDRSRGPGWTSPPSSSNSPSDASQPARKGNELEEKRSTESSPSQETRRRPDWNNKPDDRNSSNLELNQRGQQDQQNDENQEQSE